MLEVAIGHSVDPDTPDAAQELIQACKKQLQGKNPNAGILYAAIDYDFAVLLEAICAAFEGIQLIGCSTDGEASSALEFCEDSVTFIAFSSDDLEFGAGIGTGLKGDPSAAAAAAVELARAALSSEPCIGLTTPEGLGVNGVSVVENLQGFLGAKFPLFGGLASDQSRFEGTFQFCGKEVHSNALPLLLIGGPLKYSHGVASGWEPIGRRVFITKSERNVVHKIGDETALEYYRRYFGEQSSVSPQNPLAVFYEEGKSDFYLRAPASGNEEDQSITFFADVPEGSEVSLTRAKRSEILDGTRQSVAQAVESYPGKFPQVALFISCNSRHHLLGTQTKLEFEILQTELPVQTQIFGFYANGEISPPGGGGIAVVHNKTFVTLLLGVE